MTASDQETTPGSAGPLGRAEVAAMIDHTLLVPEATADEVRELCAEAGRFGVAAVCVSPNMLPLGADWLDEGILTACVVGFPSGAHHSAVKVAEPRRPGPTGPTRSTW